MFVCFVHLCTCLLPATLWVACVVARRLQLARHPSASAFSRCSSSDSAGSEGRRRAMEGGGTSSAASLLGGACLAAGADGGGTCSRWSFSAPQLAALAALAAGNWLLVYHKAASLMGGIALLASPGLAWTLPLALLLVVGWGGPRRSACGPARKGK